MRYIKPPIAAITWEEDGKIIVTNLHSHFFASFAVTGNEHAAENLYVWKFLNLIAPINIHMLQRRTAKTHLE